MALEHVAWILRVVLGLYTSRSDRDTRHHARPRHAKKQRSGRTGSRAHRAVARKQVTGDSEHDEKADDCRLRSAQRQLGARTGPATLSPEEHEANAEQQAGEEGDEKHVRHQRPRYLRKKLMVSGHA